MVSPANLLLGQYTRNVIVDTRASVTITQLNFSIVAQVILNFLISQPPKKLEPAPAETTIAPSNMLCYINLH